MKRIILFFRLVRTVKLFVVMGVNWIMELISLAYPDSLFWYLTDSFNALHGAFIFAVFVLKRDVHHNLKKRCSCLFCGTSEKRKQSVSSTMITFITLSTGVQPESKSIAPLSETGKKKWTSDNNNRLKP